MINSGKEQQYYDLSSYFDENGLFCVEGWINQAAGQIPQIPAREVDPIILPKASHISTLLIRNFHERLFYGSTCSHRKILAPWRKTMYFSRI